MVKAGALYYAIFISFLVALLGGFFILNVWTHHAHTLKLLTGQRLERNVNSALLLAEENPGLVPGNGAIDIDLFDDGDDVVSVEKHQWGAFFLLKATAVGKFNRESAIALYGRDIFESEKAALYLADNEQYLSLSGKTVIKGDCYLPKAGWRGAYIEGNSYSGTKLTQGRILNSKPQLPLLNASLLATNEKYFTMSVSSTDTLSDIALFLKTDSLSRSFFSKTLVLYSKEWISISDMFLQGNIRILSSKGVSIAGSVLTDNIIVYAPKIEVEKGFTGNLQLFASDTILINEDVHLLFPSIVAIPETRNNKALISIAGGSSVSGDILLSVYRAPKNSRAECLINKGALVTGCVYCNGSLEHKGIVNGSVYTRGFILRTRGSVYENHLLDATINFEALPNYYCGSLLNDKVERYKMVKWMF